MRVGAGVFGVVGRARGEERLLRAVIVVVGRHRGLVPLLGQWRCGLDAMGKLKFEEIARKICLQCNSQS